MAFHEHKVQEDIAPNLVPMIDIMFLLLLFFMLNADMSARELEEVKPAIATEAAEENLDTVDVDRITINIHHDFRDKDGNELCEMYATDQVCRMDGHWRITVQGRTFEFKDEGMKALAQVLTELANTKRVRPADRTSESERKVLIRADRTAPYGYIQKALEQCGVAGLYKTEFGVGIPKESANRSDSGGGTPKDSSNKK